MADNKKNPVVERLSKIIKLKKVKQEAYRLDDANIMFVVTKEGACIPFKIGDNNFKNVLTNDEYEFPLVFRGHSPIEHSLCKSLGLQYGVDCHVFSSFQDLLTATLDLPNVDKSKILKDYNKYLDQFPTRNPKNAEKMFCSKSSYTMDDMVEFGNATGKALVAIEDTKESDQVM